MICTWHWKRKIYIRYSEMFLGISPLRTVTVTNLLFSIWQCKVSWPTAVFYSPLLIEAIKSRQLQIIAYRTRLFGIKRGNRAVWSQLMIGCEVALPLHDANVRGSPSIYGDKERENQGIHDDRKKDSLIPHDDRERDCRPVHDDRERDSPPVHHDRERDSPPAHDDRERLTTCPRWQGER